MHNWNLYSLIALSDNFFETNLLLKTKSFQSQFRKSIIRLQSKFSGFFFFFLLSKNISLRFKLVAIYHLWEICCYDEEN